MKQRIKAVEENIRQILEQIKQLEERTCKLENKPKPGRPRNDAGTGHSSGS